MLELKAYRVNDDTVYAALDAEQAAVLYEQDTGVACEEPDFPEELSDQELDALFPETDEDERPTGKSTSIRAWLVEAKEPGMLACTA